MTLTEDKELNPEMLKVFETLPGMYLILSTKKVILTASNAYLEATHHTREELINRVIFDVFPHDLNEPFENSITSSLNYVLSSGQSHTIPAVAVYNTKIKNALNRFKGYWKTSHTPVFNEAGELIYIIHHTQDDTQYVLQQQYQQTILEQERVKREFREQELIRLNTKLEQANEEIQSYNEELHATNDELSASNEVLQALQSHLKKFNSELEERVEERSRHALIAQAKSEQQQNRLYRFLMQAPAGICLLTGPEFNFELVNPHYQNLFPKRRLLGLPLLEAVPEINGEPILDIIKTVYYTGKTFEGKEFLIPLAKYEGGPVEDRYFNFIYQASRNMADEIEGVLVFSYEVTEMVAMLNVQKYNEQKKDEFLSIASHELKTPLTSIRAFNQLIKRTKDSNSIDSFLQKSADAIYKMEKLVNDLLDVTKINAGKMNYDMQEFNFLEMLKDSIESVQFTKSTYEITLESEDDVIFRGDRYRIEQVVQNFLTNAIKYSPKNKKVLVKCSVKNNNIIVSVKDYGIGIAQEDLNKLFERYYRVDNRDMRFEGLGLGLFISSEILKRHNGSFWIESVPGEGSTFYFRLPLFSDIKSDSVKSLNDFYEDNSIRITLNESKTYLIADWIGFHNLETVQHGCLKILEILSRNSCYKVINDNTHVLGTWSEATEWVSTEWFPMMEEAGLKYFAWVYSPSAFSLLSARKSVDLAMGSITTQFFSDASAAEAWILNK